MACTVNEKTKNAIFLNIIISCIVSSLLMTALITALPAVVRELDVPISTGQWLTSGYTLIMGAMLPLTAFLITRFPTKRLYLTGLGLSVLGLFFCAIAPNFPVMMLARGLQACGNGITSSMSQVVLLSIYPMERRGAAMGWYGLSIGAAPAIAPLLAGIVVDTLGWRAIFVFVLVVLSVCLLWGMRVFKDVLEVEEKKLDAISFLLSVITLGGITLGVGNISGGGLTSPLVWPFLTAGVVAGILFVRKQVGNNRPFLNVQLLKTRNFMLAVVSSTVLYFTAMGVTMLLPLYNQSVRGYSATTSGLVILPGALLMAITSLCAGKLYDKIGIKKLFIAGATSMLASNVSMTFLTMETPLWIVAMINLMFNVAIGCLLMPLLTWGIETFSGASTAHGSVLLNAIRTVAGAIGTAVFVGIMGNATDMLTPVQGFRNACLCMLLFTVGLLTIALFFVKRSPCKVGVGKEK